MDEKFENQIEQMIDNAEKMARDYELAIKKSKYEIKCPYPKIIKIYEDIRQKLIDYGWNEQAVICNKQIKFYREKLEIFFLIKSLERILHIVHLCFSLKISPLKYTSMFILFLIRSSIPFSLLISSV